MALIYGKNCAGTYTLAWGKIIPARGIEISLHPFRVRWFDIFKYPLGK